jgi:BlaI family penicillinase repressor
LSLKTANRLTPLELRIMSVLWETGPSTVQVVQEKLSGDKLAYTTVQTMLNILHRKRRVKRVLKGKAYEYQSVLSKDKAIKEAIGDLVDRLFGGSIDGLVMNLLKTSQLRSKMLARLSGLVDKHQQKDLRRKENKDERD